MNIVIEDLKKLKWQNFLILFIAGSINAVGVTIFLAPVKLYDSGIRGVQLGIYKKSIFER